LLTYLLIPWNKALLQKLTGFHLVKKFPAFYGTRRLITAFTSPRHLSLSWASSIQSIPPNTTSWRSVLILSYHLRLGLPSCLIPSGFPTKILCTPLFSPIRATCPARLILLDFITPTTSGEQYRSLSSSLCSFHHSRYLVPFRLKYSPQHHILTHTQSTFLPQCERLSFTPIHSNRQSYSSVYPIFKFLDNKLKDKRICTDWQQAFPDFIMLLISSWIEF